MTKPAESPAISRRNDPRAYVQITRPGNVVITALTVLVAGVISQREWTLYSGDLVLAAISAALIAAGGNVFNDYCDRGLDRLQKPHRPLPAGRMSAQAAWVWAWALLGGGVLISVFIHAGCLIIAALAAGLLVLYSTQGKSQPLVGNLLVALIAALTFLYGGMAAGRWSGAIWPAWLAFLFHLGREIVKDLEDREGDSAAGVRTLPVRFGLQRARLYASFAFILLMISLPLPYYLKTYTTPYILIVLGGVLPVLLLTLALVWKWSQPQQLGRISLLLKLDMLVGLAALYLGRH